MELCLSFHLADLLGLIKLFVVGVFALHFLMMGVFVLFFGLIKLFVVGVFAQFFLMGVFAQKLVSSLSSF